MTSKYKAIALDLDGTLTNSEKEVSSYNKKVIHEAIKLGVKVILASGRPALGIDPVEKALELEKLGGYVIAYNGGKVYNCKTKEIIYNKLIDNDLISKICDFAHNNEIALLTYDFEGIVTESPNDKYVRQEAFNNKISIRNVSSLKNYINYPIEKMMIVGEPEKIQNVLNKGKDIFSESLNLYCSEPYFLEIMPPKIEKAFAMDILLQSLNIKREELIVCGDGLNDIPLLKIAGLPVAMSNAYEEVKSICDYITASNDEDGVAKTIEKFIL